jgi:hypothetical protein
MKSAQTLIHRDSFTGDARLRVGSAPLFHTVSLLIGLPDRSTTSFGLGRFTFRVAIVPGRRQARTRLFASHRIEP